MGQIDTSIYANLLAPPKSPEEYTLERQSIEANAFANALNKSKVDEYQRGIAKQGQLQNLLSSGIDSDGLRRNGYLDEANKWAESTAKVQSEKSQAKKFDADAFRANAEGIAIKSKLFNEQLGRLTSPQSAVQLLTAAYHDEHFAPLMQTNGKTLEQAISEIPQDPVKFREWQMKGAEGLKTLEDLALKVRQQDEVERDNKARVGATYAGIAERRDAAKMADSRARDRLAFDRDQPKGQIVQTDQGTMVIDPRSGSAIPATGPGGLPLTRPLKDIPPTVNKAIVENSQNLSKIQQALDLLDGKQVGKLTGDQNATGWKGYVPNALLNRADPSGVDTRAMIADISSLVLHDRSGAAVTASESPRLYPFIPLATDDPETAKKKLTRFKQLYEQENQALGETYSKDQGYRDNPMLKRSPSGNPPPKPPGRTVVRTGTHQGRKVTQFSDGSIVYAD